MSDPDQPSIFEPLYALIAETVPRLKYFLCYRNWSPAGFMESCLLKKMKFLDLSPEIRTDEIMAKADAVINTRICQGTFKAFHLPHTTEFSTITHAELSACGLDEVQDLSVVGFVGANLPSHHGYTSKIPPLRFRKLCTLRIGSDDRHLLLYIIAPKLWHLTIEASNNLLGADTITMIGDIFVKEIKRVRIAPTHFYLEMALSPSSAVQIMYSWPQLVHLEFQFTVGFSWEEFARSMCKKESIPCPNLRVLQLYCDSRMRGDQYETWLEAAEVIIRYRKGVYPLEAVHMGAHFHTSSVTISDV
jgi:hypothetical protein